MKNKYVYTFLVFVVNFAIAQDLEILPFKKCLDLCSSETNIYFKEIQNFVKSSNSDYENAGIRPNPVFNTQILFLTDTKYKPIKDKLMYVSEYNRQDWFQITKKTNPFGQRKNGILTAQRNYEHDISQSEIDLMELKYKAANLWIDLWLNQNNLILSQKAVKSLDSLINGSKLNPESDEYLRYIILDDQYDLNLINIEEENYVLTQTISRMLNLNSTVKVDSSSFFAFYNEKLKDTAVISNPKLKEIESQLIYDHQNYQFQKKMMVSGPEMGVIANPQNRIPYLGIFFTQTIPVFDKNQKNISQAKIQMEVSNLRKQTWQQEQLLAMDIQKQKLKMGYLKMKKMQLAASNADKLLQNARMSFTNGKNQALDIWEAEATWFETHSNLNISIHNYMKAKLDTLYLFGIL